MLISENKKDLYANYTKNKHVCFLLKYKEKDSFSDKRRKIIFYI